MVEHEFIETYPYRIRCKPPEGDPANKVNKMAEWLNANVKWDQKLETGHIPVETNELGETIRHPMRLHHTFRVATLEDVGLIKMRF